MVFKEYWRKASRKVPAYEGGSVFTGNCLVMENLDRKGRDTGYREDDRPVSTGPCTPALRNDTAPAVVFRHTNSREFP